MQLWKLSVSLVNFPFFIAQTHLKNVLSMRLFLILRAIDDSLTNCDMEVLFIKIQGLLLKSDWAATIEALLNMSGKGMGLYPFIAVHALHGLTAFHHLFELLYSIILLL